jgi:putative membrane protein
MKNSMQESRRNFLTKSLTGAAVIGAGATFMGSLLEPVSALAQAGQSDASYRSQIGVLGLASLQTSQLALTKASNAQVKMFAKFEAAEQQTMSKILKDMGTPAPALNAEGKTMLTKLQGLSGAAFDKAFMQGQVQTHLKLRNTVTAYMNASSDMHVKHLTSLALCTIKEHIELGQMLLTKLS